MDLSLTLSIGFDSKPRLQDRKAAADDLPSYRSGGMTLTPDLERGVGVPPGYALVQCVGTLEVSVVVRP